MKSARTDGKYTLSELYSVLCESSANICRSEIASYCAEMFYSLEQQIFHCLDFDIAEMRQSFQRKFNVTIE